MTEIKEPEGGWAPEPPHISKELALVRMQIKLMKDNIEVLSNNIAILEEYVNKLPLQGNMSDEEYNRLYGTLKHDPEPVIESSEEDDVLAWLDEPDR